MAKSKHFINYLFLGVITLASMQTLATEPDNAIARCLRAWGQHPFGDKPAYKTLGSSFKLFGMGSGSTDTETTDTPFLVLVNRGVNIMGGETIELLNPNGWYCLRNNVNVMGDLTIRVHCKAHLASSKEGITVLGSNSAEKSTTVMGSTQIESVGCN